MAYEVVNGRMQYVPDIPVEDVHLRADEDGLSPGQRSLINCYTHLRDIVSAFSRVVAVSYTQTIPGACPRCSRPPAGLIADIPNVAWTIHVPYDLEPDHGRIRDTGDDPNDTDEVVHLYRSGEYSRSRLQQNHSLRYSVCAAHSTDFLHSTCFVQVVVSRYPDPAKRRVDIYTYVIDGSILKHWRRADGIQTEGISLDCHSAPFASGSAAVSEALLAVELAK